MSIREYTPTLSDAERTRRWELYREKLIEKNLDGALIYGHTLQQMGSCFQYLTQIWGKDGGSMLIFPVEGEPHMVIPAYGGTARFTSSWVNPDYVRPTVSFAEDVADELISMGLERSRIGVDSFSTWPSRDYRVFCQMCPCVELVDMSMEFGKIRARKSEEELRIMKEDISLAEKAHTVFMENLVPGTNAAEAVAKAESVLIVNGASRDRIILTHSNPQMVYPYTPKEEIISREHPITLSTEFTMTRGGGCQVIRTYAWEKPKGNQARMFGLIDELRECVTKVFRPGVEITKAGAEITKMIEANGFQCDKLGHACGASYGELPFITSGPQQLDYMEWTIQEDEVYVVHPMIRGADGTPPFVWAGDMFYVGKKRTEWLTQFKPDAPILMG